MVGLQSTGIEEQDGPMASRVKLDDVSKQIIEHLQRDGRMSFARFHQTSIHSS